MNTETKMIRTDSDTQEKLKILAGKKSLSAFLRDIANGVEQKPVPVNELEVLRASILKKQDTIEKRLQSLDDNLNKVCEIIIDIENTIDALADDIGNCMKGHDEALMYMVTRQSILENALKDGLPIDPDAIAETTQKLMKARK